MSTPLPTDLPAVAGGRPPVEYRFLGLDRRTFALPLIVVGVFVLWAFVVPTINGSIGYDDPVRAGDVLIIGSTATMAPPVGWGVESGIRVGEPVRAGVSDPRVALVGDGVSVTTSTGPFRGDAGALVKQLSETDEKIAASSSFTIKGQPRTITIDGRHGVVQEFKTVTGEGAVFGFVEDGQGISLVVAGTDDALTQDATKLGRMLASIDFDAEGVS
ncbi:hypothetical protein OJ998_17780 [Solirubrobacter taibaiensis]|nr:hypothetical protein [Solirubrobacter taibaiensis]